MRRIIILIELLSLMVANAWGHFCDNVYRVPGRLLIKPEMPIVTAGKSGSFRLFLKNNYPYSFGNVKLSCQHEAFYVEIEPAVIPEIMPGEKKEFTLRITPKPGAQPGEYPLKIVVSTNKMAPRVADKVTISGLKEYIKQEGNHTARVVAAEWLAMLGDKEGFRFLADFVRSPQYPFEQAFAARVLGELRDKSAIELLKQALSSRERLVRGSAAWGLGCIGDKKLIPLLRQLDADSDLFVSTSAKAALAVLGDKTAWEGLRKALNDRDGFVRVAAASAWAYLGSQATVSQLETLVKNPDYMLSTFAGRALLWARAEKEKGKLKIAKATGNPKSRMFWPPDLPCKITGLVTVRLDPYGDLKYLLRFILPTAFILLLLAYRKYQLFWRKSSSWPGFGVHKKTNTL